MKLFPLLFLIVLLLVAIGQMAFFYWVFFKLRKTSQPQPLSPEAYRFIVLIIATVLAAVSICSSVYTIALLRTGGKAVGTVTAMRALQDKDGDETFAPTFTFVDPSGATNTVDSNSSSWPARFHVGDRVPVVYWKSDPLNARIDRFFENWFLPLFMGGFAILCLTTIPIYRKWRQIRDRTK